MHNPIIRIFLRMFIRVYFLPLHVSALIGHLRVGYTTISGSYLQQLVCIVTATALRSVGECNYNFAHS
jgi:hypothetical protein